MLNVVPSPDPDLTRDIKEDVPLLRAVDPNLRRCSQSEIVSLLQSLSPEEQVKVFDYLNTIRRLTKTGLAALSSSATALVATPEAERLPRENELQRIKLSDCLVLTKTSKRDWDMRKAGCSEEELVASYQAQGFSEERIQRILSAHQEHLKSLSFLEQQFRDAGVNEQRVFVLDQLTREKAQQLADSARLVIALGGDDNAKAVSHLVTKGQYFCAVNSDVGSSVGGLTAFSRTDIPALFRSLATGDFLLQEWPRLEIEIHRGIDGSVERQPPALSEVVLTEEGSLYTLRATFNPAKREDEAGTETPLIHSKGSGVIVSSGAGSTGWFSSAAKYIYPDGRKFPRTAKRFEFVSREPYGDPIPEEKLTGSYKEGETMVMRVNSKHKPVVSGDSVWMQPVKDGDEVHVRLGDEPLKVITAYGSR